MSFVKAQCENCGGVLEVDSSKKAAICPYCGTPYVVQDAINHYHTHIHADNLVVNDDRSAKARLDAAAVFMKLGKYDDALLAYEEASKLAPQDYHVWWGQILAITRTFSIPLTKKSELDKIHTLYKSTLAVIPQDQKPELFDKFDGYYSHYRNQNDQARSALQGKIVQCNEQLRDIDRACEKLNSSYRGDMRRWLDKFEGLFSTVLIIGLVLFFIKKNNLILVGLGFFAVIYVIHDLIICTLINAIRDAKRKAANRKSEKLSEQKYKTRDSISDAENQLKNL